MEQLRHIIRNIIKESLNIMQEATIYDDGKNIPQGIKDWVKRISGSGIPRYKIVQGESEVQINTPWTEASRDIYQFFKLINNNATPMGNEISRSGMEGDSPQGAADGEKNQGKVKVPEGYVFVRYSTHPRGVEIYTGENTQSLLPADKTQNNDLTQTELIILASAKSLKAAYRIKFKDEDYLNLIAKGLLKNNRAITIDGMNLLQDPEIKEKVKAAKEQYHQQTGRYLSF